MGDRIEVCLAGEGGQGLVLSGIILAEAAMDCGKNVVQSENHGPEARGGSSRSDIIMSSERIDFPHVTEPDAMLVMNQDAAGELAGVLKEGGILLHDSELVESVPAVKGRVVSLPFTRIATEVTGKAISANIVALGALNALANLVDGNALAEAVRRRVPQSTIEANMKALEAGCQAVIGLAGAPRGV